MLLSLTLICVAAGGVLAGVNALTKAPVEASKKAKLENAIRNVVPAFDNSPAEEVYYGKVSETDSLKIYPAKKDGKLVGFAVESNTMKGFGGEIKVIVGLDPEGKVFNYAVLQHAETPGLGDKMDTWFKTNKNKQNIIGKKLNKEGLKVTKDGGDVDAITAATISSRAFLDAVNRAYAACSGLSPLETPDAMAGATALQSNEADATTGATTQQTEETDTTTRESKETDATTSASN